MGEEKIFKCRNAHYFIEEKCPICGDDATEEFEMNEGDCVACGQLCLESGYACATPKPLFSKRYENAREVVEANKEFIREKLLNNELIFENELIKEQNRTTMKHFCDVIKAIFDEECVYQTAPTKDGFKGFICKQEKYNEIFDSIEQIIKDHYDE